MPSSIQVIWTILLVVVVLLLPVIVALLHRTWLAARSIDQYFAEMLTAAGGVAGNTVEIQRLDQTIEGATVLLTTAQSIHDKAETVRSTLSERAAAMAGPQASPRGTGS